MRRRLLIPALFLVFALPAIACGGTTGAGGKATAAPLPQGQTAHVKNWDVTLKGVEQPGKDLAWSSFGNKSTAVGTWLIAIVDLKNTGKQNFGVNSFDFELSAVNGTTYKTSTDGGALSYSKFKGGQDLSGAQVPPGTTATYYLPFDVAPDATGLALTFKQDTKPRFALP